MIVVDLGCHTHGDQDSISALIARFHPDVLYGFDPHPESHDRIERIDETLVIVAQQAAWTTDGIGHLKVDGTATAVTTASAGTPWNAQLFDLATWLCVLPRVPIVLKLDVEGAEHRLLPHLHQRHGDERLERILVEWHGDPTPIDLACPIEAWHA